LPRPAPLTGPEAARRTLAHRMTRVADRLRQLNTRFGLRSNRVFLVWTRWSGAERGEGREEVLAEIELLPTPRISDLTSQSRRPFSAGIFPEGSLRVDQISCGAYTHDHLMGLAIPRESTTAPRADTGSPINQHGDEKSTDPKVDFWWELHEDGRGDDPATRKRFRVFGQPARKEGSLYWAVNLERADEPRNRTGSNTQIGVDQADFPILGGG
jgi:hypothetical protein